MKKLYISPTSTIPEVIFSPEENIFIIRGNSSPEDVRAIYYPIIEWVKDFSNDILNETNIYFTAENPLCLKIDLVYFNSSSAKFLFDIIHELKELTKIGVPVKIDWLYDEEDIDMKDAGYDISLLLEMEFNYISK